MKRIYIITIIAITCCLTGMAQDSPGMAHQTTGKDRYNLIGNLSIPQVTINDDVISVTHVSGFWTIWIKDESGDICKAPETYQNEQEEIDLGFVPLYGVKYTIFIKISSGSTYTWSFKKGGVVTPTGGLVIPSGGNTKQSVTDLIDFSSY